MKYTLEIFLEEGKPPIARERAEGIKLVEARQIISTLEEFKTRWIMTIINSQLEKHNDPQKKETN